MVHARGKPVLSQFTPEQSLSIPHLHADMVSSPLHGIRVSAEQLDTTQTPGWGWSAPGHPPQRMHLWDPRSILWKLEIWEGWKKNGFCFHAPVNARRPRSWASCLSLRLGPPLPNTSKTLEAAQHIVPGQSTTRRAPRWAFLPGGESFHGAQVIHPSIHVSIHASIHPSMHPSIYVSIHPSTHPSIHASMHPCMHACIHPSIHPCVHPSTGP